MKMSVRHKVRAPLKTRPTHARASILAWEHMDLEERWKRSTIVMQMKMQIEGSYGKIFDTRDFNTIKLELAIVLM